MRVYRGLLVLFRVKIGGGGGLYRSSFFFSDRLVQRDFFINLTYLKMSIYSLLKKTIEADETLTEVYELEKDRMGIYWDEDKFYKQLAYGSHSESEVGIYPTLSYLHLKAHPMGSIYAGFGVPMCVKNEKTGKYETKYVGETEEELLEIARAWAKKSQYPKTKKEEYEIKAREALKESQRYKRMAEEEEDGTN